MGKVDRRSMPKHKSQSVRSMSSADVAKHTMRKSEQVRKVTGRGFTDRARADEVAARASGDSARANKMRRERSDRHREVLRKKGKKVRSRGAYE